MNSGAFDPFDELADLCAAHGAWLHVDGAFGLWAAASPELRHLVDGVDRADSWATDCHKWLNVPYDSAAVFVRDADAHAAAMTWQTSYVMPGAGREPYRFAPEASRRARGFAVWAAIAQLGADGIAEMIERCCANARRFAAGVAAEPGVEILNDVVLNQVVVRFGETDAVNEEVVERVQAEGTCFLGGTTWREPRRGPLLDDELVDHRRRHRPLGGGGAGRLSGGDGRRLAGPLSHPGRRRPAFPGNTGRRSESAPAMRAGAARDVSKR